MKKANTFAHEYSYIYTTPDWFDTAKTANSTERLSAVYTQFSVRVDSFFFFRWKSLYSCCSFISIRSYAFLIFDSMRDHWIEWEWVRCASVSPRSRLNGKNLSAYVCSQRRREILSYSLAPAIAHHLLRFHYKYSGFGLRRAHTCIFSV